MGMTIAEKILQSHAIEDGVRIQAIVSMAEKSYRESRMVRFDAAARKMVV